jgi:hypothetical protein
LKYLLAVFDSAAFLWELQIASESLGAPGRFNFCRGGLRQVEFVGVNLAGKIGTTDHSPDHVWRRRYPALARLT